MRFAMATRLRSDFDASGLRVLARNSKDAGQARRLLALAMIYEGGTRTEAAKTGGVTLRIVRDWVVEFNACGPSGLIGGKGPGQPSLLNDAQRAALAAVVESGPAPAVYGVVRWRLVDLCHWVWEMSRISISPQAMSRELRAMDCRKLSVRPRHHGQAEGAIALFNRVSPACRSRLRAIKASTRAAWKSGSAMKPASVRRRSWGAAGQNAAPGRWRCWISAPRRPAYSARPARFTPRRPA